MTPPRYYSNLPSRPRSRPSDGLPATGVFADATVPHSIIGIAYPYSHIGGFVTSDPSPVDSPPVEVVWRLVLDRIWRDGQISRLDSLQPLEARYVLRAGEFIELAEAAF